MDRYLKSLVQITPTDSTHTCDYAVTITLHPSMYRLDPETQLRKTSLVLKRLFYDCKLTLIAELTEQCNIHYHGILSYPIGTDVNYRFHNQLRKIKDCGRSECKQVMNYDLWVKYLNKDIINNIRRNIFYPIILDEYDIINVVALDVEDV